MWDGGVISPVFHDPFIDLFGELFSVTQLLRLVDLVLTVNEIVLFILWLSQDVRGRLVTLIMYDG